MIDLRNLRPDADVRGAVALAFSSDQQLAQREVRRFLGFPSQEDGWTHYESNLATLTDTLTASGTEDLPLVFLTGQRLSAEAALLTSSLRLQGKAAIVGYNVSSAVAESTWSGIENEGLLWRQSLLSVEGNLFPDWVEADLESSSVEEAIEFLDEFDFSLRQISDPVRSTMATYERDALHTTDLDNGEMQAGLMIAYGTLDWFYPYFDLVGRELDDALLTELVAVQQLSDGDRSGMMQALGRLMHSIHDGHGFYSDWAGTDWPDGYLGIQIHNIEGAPVVRTSVHPDLQAGDTITGIEGQSATDWYIETMLRYSASSEGYRFVQASGELKEVYGARELELQDPSGSVRTITAAPQSYTETMNVPWGGTDRPSGWLTALNAENIYYANMSGMITPEMETITNEFDAILDGDGIVLDMRDYPYLDIYEFARYFNPSSFTAPHFGFPTWSGPNSYDLTFEIWSFAAGSRVFEGPIVILVSNKSVSAAECFIQMLMPLDNVTIIGQQSASTNGTITNAWLPGQLQITFTGMRLLNLDGSDFHGIGVVPDIVVTPTAAEFEAGIDPELETALDVLLGE